MTLLVSWPTVVDDSGDGQSGTVGDAAWANAVKASIEDQVHSVANPTLKPHQITDEVVTARGSKASLDARLDVSLNEDGTPKPVAGQAALTDVQGVMAGKNLVINDDFLIWPAGDSAVPAGWAVESGSPTIGRCGTGLGDTTTLIGPFCMSITNAGDLVHVLLSATAFTKASWLKGKKLAVGAMVKATIASHARIYIDDGVTTTVSRYHPGDGSLVFLNQKADLSPLVHTIADTATKLEVHLEVSANGAAYFGGVVAMLSSLAVSEYKPCDIVYGTAVLNLPGDPAALNVEFRFAPARPTLWKDVFVECLSNAGGADLIVDVDRWDGSSWVSMFATRPTVAIGAAFDDAQPDSTTYKTFCSAGGGGAARSNNLIRAIVDQAATSGAKNAQVHIRGMQYVTPLERYRAHNEVG